MEQAENYNDEMIVDAFQNTKLEDTARGQGNCIKVKTLAY